MRARVRACVCCIWSDELVWWVWPSSSKFRTTVGTNVRTAMLHDHPHCRFVAVRSDHIGKCVSHSLGGLRRSVPPSSPQVTTGNPRNIKGPIEAAALKMPLISEHRSTSKGKVPPFTCSGKLPLSASHSETPGHCWPKGVQQDNLLWI